MPLDEAGKAAVARIKTFRDEARVANNRFLELIKSDKAGAVAFLLKESVPLNAKWQDAMHDFADLQREKNKKDEEAAQEAYESSRLGMLCLTIAALVAGAGLVDHRAGHSDGVACSTSRAPTYAG